MNPPRITSAPSSGKPTNTTIICIISFLLPTGMGLNLNLDDYQLICPGKAPVPIDKFSECHLAKVPAHAVVTRPEKRDDVVKFLKTEQVRENIIFN